MQENPSCQSARCTFVRVGGNAFVSAWTMQPVSVDHYENFPVASLLCPARLRPAVAAIYWFARTADDIADEGDASPARRLADLADYRAQLDAALAGSAPSDRWPTAFEPLARSLA